MLANDVVIEETFSPTNEVPIVESLTQNQTTAIQAEDVVVVVNEQDANTC